MDEELEELQKELEVSNKANYSSMITAQRGRLIRKLQSKIHKLKKAGVEDEETKELLEKLEIVLKNELQEHKEQLDSRYRKEFIEKKATVPSVLTVLPKAVGFQIKKIGACIREMFAAKTNKQRIFGGVEALKSLSMTVATPVIYAGKFVVDHWYVLALAFDLIRDSAKSLGKGILALLSKFAKKKKDNDDDKDDSMGGKDVTEGVQATAEQTELIQGITVSPAPGGATVPVPPVVSVPGDDKEGGLAPNPGDAPASTQAVPDESVFGVGAVGSMEGATAVNPGDVTVSGGDATAPVGDGSGVNTTEIVPPIVNEVTVGELVDSSVINDENIEEVSETTRNFFDGLERHHSWFIGEFHDDVQVVNSAEEFVQAYFERTGKVIDVSEAADIYAHINSLPPCDRTGGIVWAGGIESEKYFATANDAMQYVLSGEDEYLTMYYEDFTRNQDSSLFSRLQESDLVKNIANTLGVSTKAALELAIIYETVQYGLAPVTNGLSLGLPG